MFQKMSMMLVMELLYDCGQVELDQLSLKYGRLEKERNDLKVAVDRLENKVRLTSKNLSASKTKILP